MKKIIPIAIVVILLIVFVPRLVHKCDDCGETFVGTGYEANVVAEFLEDENDQIICEKCAEKHHALSILGGKTLDDFKRGLFD